MKASHLLFVLFALTCVAIPQLAHSDEMNVHPFSSTPRLLLKGKIGDYPITMSLFLYPETVYGNYSYQKKNSSLELIGTLNYDKVQLYEYANHLNTGVFEGKIIGDKISGTRRIMGNMLTGTWRPVNKKDSPLPFSLSLELGTFEKHSFRFEAANIFLIQSGERTLFMDLSKEISNPVYSCKTVFSDTKNGHHYGVIRFEGFSLGGCRERGACGCGIEIQFVWIDLDPEFNISGKKVVRVTSCLKDIELNQKDDIEKFFSDRERTKLQATGVNFAESKKFSIEFDKTSPEKGFLITTEPVNK